MKFLVLSCLLASATAAPSGSYIAPLTPVLLTAAPTVDSGDIEAAAINAKVYSEDQARAFDDQARHLADQAREFTDQARELTNQAREFTEQAVEETKDKTIELNDQVREKSEEAFWSVEDKKWQALDAVNTAEAKLDGAIARNANNIARSAFGVIVPIAPAIAPAPIAPAPLAPIAPFQPILTPLAYSPFIKEEMKKDDKKDEKAEDKKEYPITKLAEGEKMEKLDENKLGEPEKKPLALTLTPFFIAPAPLTPGFNLGQPILPAHFAPFQYALPNPLIKQW